MNEPKSMTEIKDLVFVGEHDKVVTNSLIVAEEFKKDHSNVVLAIDNLVKKLQDFDNQCDLILDTHHFEVYYEDVPQPNGGVKPAKRYVMDRDGFTLLAMGFTGKRAIEFKLKYIKAFNVMEAELKRQQAQQRPLTAEEMFLQSAQIMLEQRRRVDALESRMDAMEAEREANTHLLLEAVISENAVPEQTMRSKVRELVNEYAAAASVKQQDIWHYLYKKLYYLHGVNLNAIKNKGSMSKLELVDNLGHMDKLYDIISEAVRVFREEHKKMI